MRLTVDAIHALGLDKFKSAIRNYRGKPVMFHLVPSWFLAILFKIAIEIIAIMLKAQAADGIEVDLTACMPETIAEFAYVPDHRSQQAEDSDGLY